MTLQITQNDLTLQELNPDLYSQVRRNLNALKQKQVIVRKNALTEILKVIKTQKLPGSIFQQIGHMGIKDFLKCFSDQSQACRQLATNIVIQLLPRSTKISAFLPYILSVLVDRTNCYDLEGISNIPQKMRPPPGQKPKVLIKVIENCQEIRILYCNLIRKIVSLLYNQNDQIRKYLDDLINICRALIMDPAPEVQKTACQTLQLICKSFKDLLLHYTQLMGRAVLLPLISKKSKIRIAGLNTLTAIFWCGLYKYNAFVFENLIGFRDPNSVPIKDFYQPSHNINYLATFITDSNNRVRVQFMKNLKVWICDLDDKYDHHGKLVPYLLSGLFDKDQEVQKTALEAIDEIGRQIQTEREKDFRQSKQFAIDAKWTWEGKLVNLPVTLPLEKRPSLGSRFFIRGHVRKFWSALYRQIKDINMQNRKRACNLAVYGCIYTENYLTQYLDNMIPHLLTAVIPHQSDQIECCKKIQKMFYYIGRYCEQSTYLHILKSSIEGKLVQNQQFIKAALVAFKNIIEGSLQAIPGNNQGLFHKKKQLIELFTMIEQSGMIEQIYSFNSKQVQNFVQSILNGLKNKATSQDIEQIFSEKLITLIKLWCVGYYEQTYKKCFKIQNYHQDDKNAHENIVIDVNSMIENINPQKNSNNQSQRQKSHNSPLRKLNNFIQSIVSLYPEQFIDSMQQYLSDVYQNPPSLMDSDWKLVIVLNNYFIQNNNEDQNILFSLTQQIISESLSYNRSIEILNFCFKYIRFLFGKQLMQKARTEQNLEKMKKNFLQITKVLQRCVSNLNRFKPQKKVPVYDQHLQLTNQKGQQQSTMKINEDTFLILFQNASEALRNFYANKINITNSILGQILQTYIELSHKAKRTSKGVMESIKTLWILFERQQINESFPKIIAFQNQKKQNVYVLPIIIDFLIERIQTLGQPEHKKVSMIFSILENWLKCFPVFSNAAVSIPMIYPNYIQLFEKLIKYAMDQKDIQLKQKLTQFLRKSVKKIRPWFELECKMATQAEKFIKVQFMKQILNV